VSVRPRPRFQALPTPANANLCEESREKVRVVAHTLAIDFENGIDLGTPEELIAKQNDLSITDSFYAAEFRARLEERGVVDSVLAA